MNYLITGGAGFIGSNLARHILETEDAKVVLVDNLTKGSKDYVPKGAEFKDRDITLLTDMVSLMYDVDVVIHLAAHTGVLPSIEDPMMDFWNNVLGTFNIFEAARLTEVRKVIYASTGGAIAGDQEPPLNEQTKPDPISPYGCSKLCTENYGRVYSKAFDLDTVALRFSNVYGPYSQHKKGNLIPTLILKAMRGEEATIFGDGDQTRDFIYVKDLINAIMLAVRKEDIGGEVFQLATNIESSVMDIVEIINGLSQRFVGKELKVVHGDANKGEIRRNYCDITKARKVLGFEPEYDLESGLRETFEWFFMNCNEV